MAPPRSYHCEALTLKKFPMGEADLLVTLYSKEKGKVRAIARGARRSNSKLVGHFEPLTQLKLSLAQGRNLDYVTQAQVLSGFGSLKENLGAITKGLYLAELVDGVGSEANPNQSLYRLVIDALQAIEADPDSDLPLRFFELQILWSTSRDGVRHFWRHCHINSAADAKNPGRIFSQSRACTFPQLERIGTILLEGGAVE